MTPPVMSTDLEVEESCSDEFFHIEPLSNEVSKYQCKRHKVEDNLSISDDFKLIGVSA